VSGKLGNARARSRRVVASLKRHTLRRCRAPEMDACPSPISLLASGGDRETPCETSEEWKCFQGFRTSVDNPPTLSVDEKNISDFSMPQELLSFKPASSIAVQQFSNGDQERNIHCNVALSEEELQRLQEVRKLALSKDVVLHPAIAAQTTRFLSLSKGDASRALDLMMQAQQTRASYFKAPISDAEIIDDLNLGFLYVTGRDPNLRPIMVLRASRIPKAWVQENDADRLLRVVLFQLEYLCRYMFYPGRAENIVIIVDFKGMYATQLPLQMMGSIQKVLTYLYPCRTAQSFCCNLPLSLRMVFHTAKALLTARQQARLMLVEPADLGKMFAGSQLEEDLGGKRPVMQTFFPYQLNPGPFHVDGDADAGQSEAPRVHEAFTQQGLYGKMWDPRLDAEGNSYVETTPAAQSIFTACGLSLPDPPPVLDPISFGTSFTTVVTGTPDPSVTYLSVCNSSVQTRLKPSRRGWMGWLSSWLCCK